MGKMALFTLLTEYGDRPMPAWATSPILTPDTTRNASPRPNRRFAVMAVLWSVLTLAACTNGGGCGGIGTAVGGSGAVIVGDTVYIASRDGEVLALDRTTGEQIWRVRLGSDERANAIYGTPAVSGDTLYVGGYDSTLYALSLKEGEEGDQNWGEPVGGPIVGGPIVVEIDRSRDATAAQVSGEPATSTLVLVGSSDGNMYAFDADGTEEWRFTTGDKVWSAPAVSEGVAYFGSLDHNVYAVDLEDGSEKWRFPTKGGVVATPVVAKNRVFVGSFDGIFYAIDAVTATEVWRFDGASSWYWGRAIATDETIYASSLDGNLYALDIETGGLRWPAPLETEGAIVGGAVILFGMVVVASTDGKIHLGDGSTHRLCDVEEDIKTPLAGNDGTIYFATEDGTVRALGIREDGRPKGQWQFDTSEREVADWSCTGPTTPAK